MPIFTQTGHSQDDKWLVDGSPVFGTFPSGLLSNVPDATPIWLKVGTAAYGTVHILKRHGVWVAKHKKPVAQLVWEKLGQPGKIHLSEEKGKLKINLHVTPSALLILQLQDKEQPVHFSVTSLYYKEGTVDGDPLGKYPGRPSPRLLVGAAFLAAQAMKVMPPTISAAAPPSEDGITEV